jgi:hypothetical protein
MGQKTDFPFETTERFRGNRTSYREVTVDTLPHCGHEATLPCLPKGKFKADMPSQGSFQLPAWDELGSENKRPRSLSIPIKMKKAALANDSDGSRDDMYPYDLATWRMYTRIFVHRLKYPVDLSQKVAHGVTQQASDIATFHSRYHSSDNGKLSMVDPMPVLDSYTQIAESNYYLEGEVFELEP